MSLALEHIVAELDTLAEYELAEPDSGNLHRLIELTKELAIYIQGHNEELRTIRSSFAR